MQGRPETELTDQIFSIKLWQKKEKYNSSFYKSETKLQIILVLPKK